MRTLLLNTIGLVYMGATEHPVETTQAPAQMFPMWVQIVILGILALVVIWILKNVFSDFFTALLSRKKTVQATLVVKVAEGYVNKKMYIAPGGAGTGVAGGVAEKGIEYRFDFQLEDGSRVVLEVPKSAYDVAVEETVGELTYKGRQFISYKARTEGTVMVDDVIDNNFVSINKKF